MDILIVVLAVAFYIGSINSSIKKKKARRERKRSERMSKPRFDQAFPRDAQPVAPTASAAPIASVAPAHGGHAELKRAPMATQLQMDLEHAGEGEDPCHEGDLRPARQGMRFRSVSQEGFSLAEEGEDPCHTGEAPRREESPVYDSPILSQGDDRAQALRRQVLSGVIMSEVLRRPQERRMERKLRGRA